MKWLKELWRLMGDERWTCPLIAFGCLPLTLYTILFVSESVALDGIMIALNCLMIVVAFAEDDDDSTD